MENNNKLIAEFLGLQVEEGQERIYIKGLGTKLIEKTFSTDWNWIMNVVEKIENYNYGATLFIIEDERCHVNSQNGFEIDSVGHTKIEAIYNACVEFIKWYNEQ